MASLQLLKGIIPLSDVLPHSYDPQVTLDEINAHPGHSIQQIRATALSTVGTVEERTPQQLYNIIEGLQRHQSSLDRYIDQLQPIRTVIELFLVNLEQLSTLLVSSREKSAKLSLNRLLQNELVAQLNPVVFDLMTPPRVVRSICEDPVDETWCDNLDVLAEKSTLIESGKYDGFALLEALKNQIEDLTAKCIERIRDHIIRKIKLLRLGAGNAASLQQIQKELLVTKDAYQFLLKHHPELGRQLRLAYFYTMKWYYESRFAKYIYALQKLKVRHIEVVFEDNWKWLPSFGSGGGSGGGIGGIGGVGLMSAGVSNSLDPSSATSVDPATRINEYLQLVEKRKQIFDIPAQLIPLQIAETTPFIYWQEFVFQQWIYALVDNIIVEYLFTVEFWYGGKEVFPAEVEKRTWRHIVFDNIFQYSNGFVGHLVTNPLVSSLTLVAGRSRGGDAFALLMCIRMVQSLQTKLHEVHIPIVDEHLNQILMDLWPHFTRIIDANCDAMKKAILHTKSTAASLAPLASSQQLAQYIAGLLKIAPSDAQTAGGPLFTSIRRLCNDYEVALTKVSNSAFRSKGSEKELFLFNNYFLVTTILKNEETGEFFAEQIAHFEMLCDAYKKK